MTDSASPQDTGPLPEAVVREKKGLPTVWIIPIVAAAIGGWLWWSALQEQGPVIQVSFLTADGLEAGKTKIKYKDVEVGTVTSIDFARTEDRILSGEPIEEPQLQYERIGWALNRYVCT